MSVSSQDGAKRLLQNGQRSLWLLGLAPLVLLGAVVAIFLSTDPLSGVRKDAPPIEELTFTRTELKTDPQRIVLSVTNGGPDAVTVAQVLVDDAYWTFEMSPDDPTIPRLGRRTITISYPWIEGEAHTIGLISSTGVVFEHEVAVAVESPQVDGSTLLTFTLLGLFVGVIPVLLGLLWLPFLRRIGRRWVNFFLALTAGLLVFLAVDATVEAIELSGDVPGAFQGIGLIILGVVAALAALNAVDGWMRSRRGTLSPYYVAVLIAIGIGLHNLGEGLAIGAAYAIGEVSLTAFLVLGFMLHNVTEGLGIVSPLTDRRPTWAQLALLGVIAGGPTIAGTWLGGLAYSPALTVLFLSIGAGAIVQVVWEIGKLLRRENETLGVPLNALGFGAGVLVMYLTGLAVAA